MGFEKMFEKMRNEVMDSIEEFHKEEEVELMRKLIRNSKIEDLRILKRILGKIEDSK